MSLLVPDTGLLFWMTLSFGIVFFILAKFAFPVIIKAVDKRNDYIKESLEAARIAEEKLATLNQQAEEILANAREERKHILQEAQEKKKKIEEDAKTAAEAAAYIQLKKTMGEIEEAKLRAVGEVKEQIAGISVKIAGKIIGAELENNQKQQELINRLLDEEVIYKS